MFARKNFPYAYHNLQEELRELAPHLIRNNLELPAHLNANIDPKVTPQELYACITKLQSYVDPMKGGNNFEQKVTGMLLERFISDAQHFQDDLAEQIQCMGGIQSHLTLGEIH